MFSFELYHQISKILHDTVKPIPPKEEWPKSWKTTYIKTFPRFKTTELPHPQQLTLSISETLLRRATAREFSQTVTLEQLSSLLYYSIGEKDSDFADGVGRRMYSSAGARFPLEFYLLNFKDIESLESGVYHYDLRCHGLTRLKQMSFPPELLKKLVTYDFALKAQFAVIFTSVFSRITPKYGERAYRFALLEAGGVMQNFSLCAEALNIGSLNMGGLIDDTAEQFLGIDGNDESIVHSMFFG